jgi:Rod binding domain-containing protein
MSVEPIGAVPLPPGAEARTPEQRAALGFERVLIGQLTEQLARTAEGEEGEESAATGAYRDLLPGALADALIAGGGLGLAGALTREDAR